MNNKLLTRYLAKARSKNDSLAAAVSALETSNNMGQGKQLKLMNYYTVAYLLSGQKVFKTEDRQFTNVTELAAYMKDLFDSSYEEFEVFCHKLIDNKDILDVQLEAWLIALGKRRELEAWRRQLSQ